MAEKEMMREQKLEEATLEQVSGGIQAPPKKEKEPPLGVDIALDVATAPLPGPAFTTTIIRLFKKWFH